MNSFFMYTYLLHTYILTRLWNVTMAMNSSHLFWQSLNESLPNLTSAHLHNFHGIKSCSVNGKQTASSFKHKLRQPFFHDIFAHILCQLCHLCIWILIINATLSLKHSTTVRFVLKKSVNLVAHQETSQIYSIIQTFLVTMTITYHIPSYYYHHYLS